MVAVFLASALLLVEAQQPVFSGDSQEAAQTYAQQTTYAVAQDYPVPEEDPHRAQIEEVATVIGEKLKSKISSKTGGKSVARGCTALLKAQHDGKMEWFESQQWYKKALKLCHSLSATDDPTAVIPGKAQSGHTFGSTKRHNAMELLKTSCTWLSRIPAENPVRQKKWFPNAESMCSTVQSSAPEDLKALLHRSEHQAETSSGQLLKKTCQEVGASPPALTDDSPVRNWYRIITAACSKLGTRKVKSGKLEEHCKWLQKVKATGKAELYKDGYEYSRLDKACSWLAGKALLEDHRHHDAADAVVLV